MSGESGAGRTILTNDAVVRLARSGLSEKSFLLMVKSQPGKYSLQPNDVIALKQEGVPERVITAMMIRTYSDSAPKPPATSARLVAKAGVYFKNHDAWVGLAPETVSWKTGSVLKSIATLGIAKRGLSGHISGAHSQRYLKVPVDFLIYLRESEQVSSFQLLRLREQDENRMFRVEDAGSDSDSSVLPRDAIRFGYEKIAPRSYFVTLPQLPEGEYGFLSSWSASAGQVRDSSQIYTFRIVE